MARSRAEKKCILLVLSLFLIGGISAIGYHLLIKNTTIGLEEIPMDSQENLLVDGRKYIATPTIAFQPDQLDTEPIGYVRVDSQNKCKVYQLQNRPEKEWVYVFL